jgi:hypothetical protein
MPQGARVSLLGVVIVAAQRLSGAGRNCSQRQHGNNSIQGLPKREGPGASRNVGGRTWVGRGYRLRVVVPEGVSDGRHDGQGDGAEGTDHAGPEEGGALARRPAPVADGRLPEEGRSAGHFWLLWMGG